MIGDNKKIVMTIIVVVCLALAAGITARNFVGSSSGRTKSDGTFSMLCVNPECGHIFELTREERQQQMREKGRARMMRGGPRAFTCPECGEDSAYQAIRCPKCDTVFISDYQSGDFTDRCPECGYSAIEEKRKAKTN